MSKLSLFKEHLKKKVSKKYYEWIDVLSPSKANELPPLRSFDYLINLKENSTPQAKKKYSMSREQTTVVKSYIDKMLEKCYIRSGTSPYDTSVPILKKSDRGPKPFVAIERLTP